MAIYNSISSWLSTVQKAQAKANYRAVNKALAKTNTQFKREMSKSLGITSKKIGKRFKTKKATLKNPNGSVGIGTKFAIPLSEFTPKVKIVRKGKRKYQGVTIRIPAEGARALVPGGFALTVSSGKVVVVSRKSKDRTPLQTEKYSILKTAEEKRPGLNKYLNEQFKTAFKAQLKYELNK